MSALEYLPYIESCIVFFLLFLYFYYRQNTPAWVFSFTGAFLFYMFIRLLVTLQGDQRFLFLQALNVFVALGILYVYYVR